MRDGPFHLLADILCRPSTPEEEARQRRAERLTNLLGCSFLLFVLAVLALAVYGAFTFARVL